jgi:O-antigen/teichoic acid export membrane protein
MVLYAQVDTFVIGKLLSLGTLGMYYLARSLADIPTTFFSKINPLFLPVFSIIQDDKEKLKKTLLKLTEIFATFGLPFFIFFIVFSRPILSLTYSPEYSVIAIPFGILCFFTFIYILSSINMNVVIATGQPDKQRNASLVRTIFFLITLYPATKYFGLIGAASSTLLSMVLCIVIQIRYLKQLINVSIPQYFAGFAKGIKYSSIILIPGILFNTFVSFHALGSVGFGTLLCIIAWCFGIIEMYQYNMNPSHSS